MVTPMQFQKTQILFIYIREIREYKKEKNMAVNGISTWVMQMVKQVAAMDGKTNILGDSDAELSIMTRMMSLATPEENDLIEKYLFEREEITNPLERNDNRTVRRDYPEGEYNSLLQTDLPEGKDLAWDEITYDASGSPVEGKFYDRDNQLIQHYTYTNNEDGTAIEEIDSIDTYKKYSYNKKGKLCAYDYYDKLTGKNKHSGKLKLFLENIFGNLKASKS